MVSTILVPLDGSPLAEMALAFAEQLARSTAAHICLTRAVPASKDKDLVAMDEARAYLEGVASRLSASGCIAETHASRGQPTAAILDQIDAHAVDLVVMATHGRSGPGRWLYGSVADEVLRRASVPIVLVGPHSRQPLTKGPVSVLVPLDGSPMAESILVPATKLAAQFGANLTLLQAIPLPPPNIYADTYVGFDIDTELAQAREYLESIAAPLRARGVDVGVRAEVGEPAAVIAELAVTQNAGLIAMATHGRSGLARMVLGSVAIGALQLSTVPLLLVRPARLTAAPAPATLASPAPADQNTTTDLVGVWLSSADVDLLDRGLAELLLKGDSSVGEAIGELRARLARSEGVLG